MSFTLYRGILDAIIGCVRRAPPPVDPLARDDGRLYCKYDSIKLSNRPGENALRVEFMWQGEAVGWLEVRGVRLERDYDTVDIVGLEGRNELRITSP
jgi:hypothetical protein